MSKWYAVKVGKIPGIYSSWRDCSLQTNGFPGSIFKSFTDRNEALEYYYNGKVPEHEKKKGPYLLRQRLAIEVGSRPLTNGFHTELFIPKINDPKNQESVEVYSYGTFVPPKIEGKEYLKYDRFILNTPKDLLVIYIDGSKRSSVNHRGSGAYCRFNNKDFCFSIPFTVAVAQKYQIDQEDYDKLSSPTMEYLAFGEVLWRMIKIRLPEIDGVVQLLNPRLKVIFVSDYLGVKCFTEGSWIPKEDYIKKIHKVTMAIIEFLKVRGIDVHVHHINGHNGVLGNELSDIAAKNVNPYDNIPDLVIELSNAFDFKPWQTKSSPIK